MQPRLQRTDWSRHMSELQMHPVSCAACWQQCSCSLLLCACSAGSPACSALPQADASQYELRSPNRPAAQHQEPSDTPLLDLCSIAAPCVEQPGLVLGPP